MDFYLAHLAGQTIQYCFHFPDTAGYLRRCISEKTDECRDKPVSVTEYEFDEWKKTGNTIDAFAEFCLLCEQTSQYLLSFDRCVFHAAAVRFRDRAWLVTAGSGVGKSTQCRYLTELWPEEVSIINGDKPILECREDGAVMVHPSPWNGKEGWHGAEAAPLAGIFLLRRGQENAIEPVEVKRAVPWIYSSVFQSWQDEDNLRLAARMTEKIVKNAQIWQLTSHEVPDSTKLLYETMCREAERHGL